MVTHKPPTDHFAEERALWCDALKAATGHILLAHDGRMTPAGAAHLCAEFADAVLTEFKRRYRQ